MSYSPVLSSLNLNIYQPVLSLSKTERYYILDTHSSGPHYVFTFTGSFGNEYFITFSKSTVSCTCDDNWSNPCKHILFILRILGFSLDCGRMTLSCTKIIDSIQKFTQSNHVQMNISVDHRTLRLCTNHYQTRCRSCKQHLDGAISVCTMCSSSYHIACAMNRKHCVECNFQAPKCHHYIVNSHRNYYNILTFCGYTLSKQPEQHFMQSTINNFNDYSRLFNKTNISICNPERCPNHKSICDPKMHSSHQQSYVQQFSPLFKY